VVVVLWTGRGRGCYAACRYYLTCAACCRLLSIRFSCDPKCCNVCPQAQQLCCNEYFATEQMCAQCVLTATSGNCKAVPDDNPFVFKENVKIYFSTFALRLFNMDSYLPEPTRQPTANTNTWLTCDSDPYACNVCPQVCDSDPYACNVCPHVTVVDIDR
jgi:hypothetical protein